MESKGAVISFTGSRIRKPIIIDELSEGERQMSKPILKDRMNKSEMIKCLRQALIQQGHTKARAQELAKIHYKKYLGCGR